MLLPHPELKHFSLDLPEPDISAPKVQAELSVKPKSSGMQEALRWSRPVASRHGLEVCMC